MLDNLRDRITTALLVLLGGAEAASDDPIAAVALVVIAAVDVGLRHWAARHGARAVAHAVGMDPGMRPLDDEQLLAALRKAGFSVQAVAEAWERQRGG